MLRDIVTQIPTEKERDCGTGHNFMMAIDIIKAYNPETQTELVAANYIISPSIVNVHVTESSLSHRL